MRGGIGLGSNVGDRLTNLRQGFHAIRRIHTGARRDLLVSSIYETSPVDCAPGTEWYLNAAVEIETDLVPIALLSRLEEVEKAMGRPSKRPCNTPRTIDLDILYLGDLVLQTPEITVPHPRLAQRRFVLAPLAEIVPNLVLPGQSRSVAQLFEDLPSAEEISKLREALDEG